MNKVVEEDEDDRDIDDIIDSDTKGEKFPLRTKSECCGEILLLS